MATTEARGRIAVLFERVVESALRLCTVATILVTATILWVLFSESLNFFREISPLEFLTGTRWAPLFRPASYGVLPLVVGSLMVVSISALLAIPVGLGVAIYLSEYASQRLRTVLKPVLEILAGIPSLVYGYLALTSITPVLRHFIPDLQIFNGLSAGIVVGVMILPMIASLCEDSLRAVPQALREGAHALGATPCEVTANVVVPAALSGILASFILALTRALGETMAVAIAAGSTPVFTVDPRQSIQTMTAFIVQVSKGDTPAGTLEFYTVFAVALLLFLMTFVMNVGANAIQRRFREVYE